jgi:hypothetical protein
MNLFPWESKQDQADSVFLGHDGMAIYKVPLGTWANIAQRKISGTPSALCVTCSYFKNCLSLQSRPLETSLALFLPAKALLLYL